MSLRNIKMAPNEKELLVESLMILFLPFNLQALHVSFDVEQYENELGITKYHILIVNKNPVIKNHAKVLCSIA